jgi:hypothetical protein
LRKKFSGIKEGNKWLATRGSTVPRMAGVREELVAARTEADKLKEAMRVRDDEVSFLRGHVSQLVQTVNQISLPPSQEEAKKKGWWQFWR